MSQNEPKETKDLLDRMIDLAVAKPKERPKETEKISAPKTLAPNEYPVHITYKPLPSFADLKKEFGNDNVSVILDGRPFQKHASCLGMVETPGDKVFRVAKPPSKILSDSEKIIAWGDKQRSSHAPDGYCPATEKEWYEFQKAFSIRVLVALGSFTHLNDQRCVPTLFEYDTHRRLFTGWFEGSWTIQHNFLFVSR